MKWIKRIAVSVMLLVFMVGLALVAFLATFDPNDYKPRIAALLETHTGQAVEIEGEIELSIFPYIGVQASKLRLLHPEPYATLAKRPHWLTIERVEGHAALLPLLRGQIDISTLKAQGLDAHILRLEDGRSNLDDLAQHTVENPPQQSAKQSTTSEPARELLFSIEQLAIADADITLEDQQTGRVINVQGLDWQADAIAPNTPIDWKSNAFQLQIEQSGLGMLAGRLALHGQARLDWQQQIALLDSWSLEFSPRSLNLDQQDIAAWLPLGDYTLSGQQLQMDWGEQHLHALGLSLTGQELQSQQLQTAGFKANAELAFDLAEQQLTISNLAARLGGRQLSGEQGALGAFSAEMSVAKSVSVDFSTDASPVRVTVPEFNFASTFRDVADANDLLAERWETQLDVAGMVLEAGQLTTDHVQVDVQGSGFAQAEQVDGALSMALDWNGAASMLNLNDLNASGVLVDLIGVPTALQWSVKQGGIHYNASEHSMRAQLPDVTINDAQLSAQMHAEKLNQPQQWQLQSDLSVEVARLHTLLAELGLSDATDAEIYDPSLHARGEISLSAQQWAVDDIAIRLDDQTLNGALAFTHTAEQPRLDITLATPQFDLTPFSDWSFSVDEEQERSASPSAHQDDTPLLGAELQTWLLSNDVQLALQADALIWDQQRLDGLGLALQNQAGLVDLARLDFAAFAGTVRSQGQLDLRGDHPRWQANMDARQIEIEPLLALLDLDARVSGRGSTNLDLHTQGLTSATLLNNLAGNVSIALEDGVVRGVDIGYWLRRADAMLRGRELAVSDREQTDFTALTVSAVIENGIAHSDDLDLRAPLFRVGGEGDFDLPNALIDYQARVTLAATAEGQDGAALDALRGVTVPLSIGGSFDSPQVRLDSEALLRGAAEDRVRDRIDRELERRLDDAEPARQLLDRFLR